MAAARRFPYLVALIAAVTAAGVRYALSPVLHDEVPYLTFFAAVITAAWYGGFREGLAATILSGVAAVLLFVTPSWLSAGVDFPNLVALAMFGLSGWLISEMSSRLHGARDRERLETARLQTTLHSIGDGVIVTEADGMVTMLNPVAERLSGWTAADAHGRALTEVFTVLNESGEECTIEDALARLRAGGVLHHHPVRLRARDGGVTHALVTASGRWQDGVLIESRWFVLDITERTRVDEVRGLLAAVVEGTEDAVISKALDGRILSWNAGAQTMFGYSPEEAVGRHINLIVPEHLRPLEQEFLATVARAERVMPVETLRVARDGQVLDVSLTLSPIRDPNGRIIGASSIARDIRGRKALEESLRESGRRKDEFLAVLAHELRNPLAPIRNGIAALRLALPDDQRIRATGDIIERQVKQMARLLDDLLDVSRITHNRLDLRQEALTLRSVLDSAQETCRPVVEAAGQAISITMPGAPIHLYADPVRLAQVFSNLISNASKYSHQGATIRITAEVRDGEVVVVVADDGIGIQPEALTSIFEMFSQATPTRAQGGIGIGLSLVRGLVELHGGRVSARSEGIGRGSAFEVRLPAGRPAGHPSLNDNQPGSDRPMNRRVLIADDNRDGADSLALVMTAFGCEVRTAYDGPSAVRTAEAFQPEVVFLDLGMPGMDGFEAARRIRSLPGGATTVLIALTGWGQERDRQRTSEAGFDAHLVKPVDPLSMRRFLDQLPITR